MKERLTVVLFLLVLPLGLCGFKTQRDLKSQGFDSVREGTKSPCRKVYERLFRKEVLDIRIVFGYKDSRPARFVGDGYEKNALIETLTKKCDLGRFDCGFHRSMVDSDLFIKRVKGPDGIERNVLLRLMASSVSPDDDENRMNPFQSWKSKYAEKAFFDGITNADIVFYNGHARDGGGPDFDPPKLLKNSRVNYSWYVTANKGPQKIQKALGSPSRSVQLIGLYSCISEKLIPKTEVSRQVGWIASGQLVYYADAMLGLTDALSSLLGLKCHDEFKFGNKETGSSLFHFF